MDLIQKLESSEFNQRLRGYDVDEVDAFHAEILGDIADMQRALDDAYAAGTAPASSSNPVQSSTPARLHDPEGTLQRMLAVAQRTADESVREAKLDGAKTIANAEQRAAKIDAECEKQRAAIVSGAAAEARRVAEATRAPLLEEIAGLEQRRDDLIADMVALEEHVKAERGSLTTSLEQLQALLADPAAFRNAPAPEIAAAETPSIVREAEVDSYVDDSPEPDEEVAPELAVEAVVEFDDEIFSEPQPEHDVPAARPAPESAPAADNDEYDEVALDDGPSGDFDLGGSVTDLASVRNEVLHEAEAPLPEPEPVFQAPQTSPYPEAHRLPVADALRDDPAPDSGPPTEVHLLDDLLGDTVAGAGRDDQFLSELRKATEDDFVEDNDSDAAMAAFFDQEEEDEKWSSRFGKK
jgi:DivIVA domain-containing protein